MAASFFSERLFEQVSLHAEVGIHLLQPSLAISLEPVAVVGSPSSRAVIWLIIDASMPPYLARHL
jgi:hypothetical protein